MPDVSGIRLPTLPSEMNGSIRSVDTGGRKLAALTFDICETAGEDSGYDGAIFEALIAKDMKATVFAGGKWLLTHPERAQQLIGAPNLEIGAHSWSHPNLRRVSAKRLRRELLAPLAAYRMMLEQAKENGCAPPLGSASGQLPRLFRFPLGACDVASLKAANDAGLVTVQWSIAPGDPSPGMNARLIRQMVMKRLVPGSIIVFHANGRGVHTSEALPGLIDDIRAEGYELVTVSALLAAGRPIIANACFNERAGDLLRYDRPQRLRQP